MCPRRHFRGHWNQPDIKRNRSTRSNSSWNVCQYKNEPRVPPPLLLYTFENDKNLFWVYHFGNFPEKNHKEHQFSLLALCVRNPCYATALSELTSLFSCSKYIVHVCFLSEQLNFCIQALGIPTYDSKLAVISMCTLLAPKLICKPDP